MTLDYGTNIQTKVDGSNVTITCYVQSGFTADDVKVTVEGDDVVIQAEFKKVVGANREEKSFSRRIHLPEGVMHNTIEASYDEKSGHLTIKARRREPEPKKQPSPPPLRREVNIPISFK